MWGLTGRCCPVQRTDLVRGDSLTHGIDGIPHQHAAAESGHKIGQIEEILETGSVNGNMHFC